MYTEKFERAFVFLISNEGGYSNFVSDKGGKTKFGITKMSYPDIDIENLDLRGAKKIYFQDFWNKLHFEQINSVIIASKMLDISVNIGSYNATKILQRALRATENYVNEDGIIGHKTIEAVNRTNSCEMLVALKSESAAYYRLVAQSNKSQEMFLNGWLNRAYKTPILDDMLSKFY